MMTHTVLKAEKGADRTASYYEDGVDDYYQKEGESKEWQGAGAEMLGLHGEVKKEDFKDLLAGRLPDGTLFRNSVRHDSNTRIGIDFTFQAPKSVSMQALVHGDAGIIRAHDKAVAAAVEELEKRAATRFKVNGQSYHENTGNLIVAKFRHETNREAEPHLHTHAVAINATRRSDGKFRALVNDELVKNPKFYGSLYRSVLAQELEALGYKLRHETDSFELAHINRKQIEGMSTRTQQIDNALEDMGLSRETSSAQQRTYLAKKTRKAKESDVDGQILRDRWKTISNDLGVDYDARNWAYNDKISEKAAEGVVESLNTLTQQTAARRAVQFAVNHFSERQTIMTRNQLIQVAMEHGTGRATLKNIEDEIEHLKNKGSLLSEADMYRPAKSPNSAPLTKADYLKIMVETGKSEREARRQIDLAITKGRLVKTSPRYTTQKAMDQERRILKNEKAGRGTVSPIMSAEEAKAFLAETTLRKDQQRTGEMILTSTDRIVGVQGKAGVGKSYMAKGITDKIKACGYNMHVLAPYGSQKKALVEDGMEARTVASFLNTQSRDHVLDSNTVILVDEAGVLPNRLMDRLVQISTDTGARLILMGDVDQTKAVEAGIPFHIMQKNGMATSLMDENQRQKNNPELLHAVELAAVGRASESVGALKEVIGKENEVERLGGIVKTYLDMPVKEREDTLIVTGTNESRVKLNNMIRSGLKIKTETEVTALTRLDTTQATRRYSRYYKPGETVIQPERDYPKAGLVRGELYRITSYGEGNTLVAQSDSGEMKVFNPAHITQLSVYKEEKQKYGVGEKLRVTRNDATLDIANGDRFVIQAIENNKLFLSDGKKEIMLDATQKQHLDYAYVTTVHSSQGLTATNVIAHIATKSKTVAKDWYYVAVSRAKERVIVYTDKVSRLPVAVSRESQKTAALDLRHKTASKIIQKGEKAAAKEAENKKGKEAGKP
ncbi:MobF family relaxase [Acinetobacter variabilis]|uniref:MobF family relaxase n=1 Tax=Acinetobacter variabilis TaxID=70346 RepID=UPI0028AAA9B0|nr:MobF family relaxase [Acinetobacter variabilis]